MWHLFLFGRLLVSQGQSSAAGLNSNGWLRWAWADSFATTGSMAASGPRAYEGNMSDPSNRR
jgi:hypothetical protein